MSKYYELVDVFQKPDKDDWYIILDPENPYSPEACYFLEGDWFESEVDARENENHDSLDVDGCSWLREISHLPLSSLTGEPLESNTGYTTADVPGEEGLEEMAEEYWASLPTSEGEVYYMIKDAYIAGALSARQQGDDADLWEWIAIFYGALKQLVELKTLKDSQGKTDDYNERQPKAWSLAKQAIELWATSDYGAQSLPQSPASLPPRIVDVESEQIIKNTIWSLVHAWQMSDGDDTKDRWLAVENYILSISRIKSIHQPGIVQNLKEQNPYRYNKEEVEKWRAYTKCCDTLARIIEGEKGKEGNNG